jgi:hypothetical protein
MVTALVKPIFTGVQYGDSLEPRSIGNPVELLVRLSCMLAQSYLSRVKRWGLGIFLA